MIRKATPFDMPALIALMRGYVSEAPLDVLKEDEFHDQPHVQALLASLMAGRGFILIDDAGRGFIAAVINSNVWCPSLMELHELAWWVQPEHRGGTLGGRLWKEFDLLAQDYLACGRAQVVCSSTISNSPKINYMKRGYRLMQTTYSREL
jgi:hypothetical protein